MGAPVDQYQAQNEALKQQIALKEQQLAQERAAMASQPAKKEYQSLLDPTTGLMKDQYQIKGDIRSDALDKYKQNTLSDGPSSWAKLATDQQGLEESGLRNKLGEQQGSALANARSSLAMRGGLSGGAAERLAKSGARDQMMGMQNLSAQGAMARGNIGMQDAQQKAQALPQLANMDMQTQLANKKIGEFNINNALTENKMTNMAGQASYDEQMKAWAATKQADAMRNSGGGGGKK